MSTTVYQPGLGGSPYGNALFANALGSDYAANSAYVTPGSETDLIRRALQETIIDAAPAKYNILKLLFEQPMESVPSDEYYWREQPFGRTPLTILVGAAAVIVAPNAVGSQTVTIAAASIPFVTLDYVVCYNDANNTKGIVTALNTTTGVMTITSNTGVSLPLILAAETLVPMSTFRADSQNSFSTYQRLNTIERYNYIQRFLRARQWGRVELLKFQNLGTTDYLMKDVEEVIKQIRWDLFASFINGTRGEFATAAGIPGKAMGGMFPLMTAAGAGSATTTIAGLQAAFEALAFATDYKSETGRRFIIAPPRLINELNKIYKAQLVRYTPSDKVADLNLDSFKFGGLEFVNVPTMLLQEPSLFPTSFANKMFIIDLDMVKPVVMNGLPAVEQGGTLMLGPNGTREEYKDYWCGANLGLKFFNPIGSFTIDVI
jgi:hypothetical protein